MIQHRVCLSLSLSLSLRQHLQGNELKPGGEVVRESLCSSGRVNMMGEIGGPVSVSVASGKGGVQVLDPTDCAPRWRNSKAQSVDSGEPDDLESQVSDIITDLLLALGGVRVRDVGGVEGKRDH